MNDETGPDIWRAQCYALLGHLLATPPDAAMLAVLATLHAADDSALARSLDALGHAARLSCPEASAAEHHALFHGIPQGEVVPYASWYLTGFLMEKPLARIRDDLQRLGICRQDAVREPEDHAAAVLEAMSLLVQDDDPEQAAFAHAHLVPWLPRFFADLTSAPSARLYRALAQVGAAFLEQEQAHMPPDRLPSGSRQSGSPGQSGG